MDSLRGALKNRPVDTTRVKIYNDISSGLLNQDLVMSRTYSDSAIQLSRKSNFAKGMATGLRIKGISLAEEGDHTAAKKVFLEGLALALNSNKSKDACTWYHNIANVSNYAGDYDSAILYSQKSLACDSSIQNKKRVYSALATAYRQKNDYTSALSYHSKNLKLCKETNDKIMEARILINMGNVYANIRQFDDALSSFIESFRILDTVTMRKECVNLNMSIGNIYAQKKRFDDAEKYHRKALTTATYLGQKNMMAQILCNIGNTYFDRCLYSKAIQYYSRSEVLATETKNNFLLTQLHINYANSYLHLKNLKKSIDEAKSALTQSEKIGVPHLKAEAYKVMGKIDSVRGGYLEALENFKKSQSIADSVFNKEKSRQLIEIREKYEAEKKAREIQKLQHEIDKKKALVAQQKFQMYSLLGITAAVVSFVFLIYYGNKTKKERTLQTKLLQKHKEVIIAQEETYKKISRDLHDNIGQKMIALKMNIEAKSDPPPDLMILIDEVTTDMRNMSHTLSPHILEADGLKAAFEGMLKSVFANFQGDHVFEAFHLKEKYPYEIEINIFRIAQELATNIVKHARANQVSVQLYENSNNLVLIFEDDGVGFDPQAQKGFGLRSVENRVQIVKGVFAIDISNGRTSSAIRIPL